MPLNQATTPDRGRRLVFSGNIDSAGGHANPSPALPLFHNESQSGQAVDLGWRFLTVTPGGPDRSGRSAALRRHGADGGEGVPGRQQSGPAGRASSPRASRRPGRRSSSQWPSVQCRKSTLRPDVPSGSSSMTGSGSPTAAQCLRIISAWSPRNACCFLVRARVRL